ncbi:hypothetical protein ElyMa_000674800 [Elysia marginata]|uniref:BESS domain-containing protein n=1 Tax=Elysia marginata TaxID=1093978 RepID=A0AAV4GHP4_9GAST|nr:hypothetical protein ElyMa_000674800 [Elysia marginata]
MFPNPRDPLKQDVTFDQNTAIIEETEECAASEERTFTGTISPSVMNDVSSPSAISCPPRSDPSPAIIVPTAGPSAKTPKAAKGKTEDQLLTIVQDHLKAPEEDENDAFAKTVAFKMRKLDPRQRL